MHFKHILFTVLNIFYLELQNKSQICHSGITHFFILHLLKDVSHKKYDVLVTVVQKSTKRMDDLRTKGIISIGMYFFLFVKLISVKSFHRTDVESGGLEYQKSRLGGLYQSGIKNLPTQPHFSSHPACLMNRGLFEKLSLRHGSHQKKKKNSERQLFQGSKAL